MMFALDDIQTKVAEDKWIEFWHSLFNMVCVGTMKHGIQYLNSFVIVGTEKMNQGITKDSSITRFLNINININPKDDPNAAAEDSFVASEAWPTLAHMVTTSAMHCMPSVLHIMNGPDAL